MNIAFIGAGGVRWGPMIIRDLTLTPGLDGCSLILYDIDKSALERVWRYAMALQHRLPDRLRMDRTLSLHRALEDRDIVILSISAGKLTLMAQELELASRFDVHHTTGDTIGPAGISRAMRHIPVILNIARQMESICPHALLLNTTNPLSPLIAAVERYSRIRTLGLCHEPHHVVRHLLRMLNRPPSSTFVRASVWGVNHFSWFTRLDFDGEPFRDLWRRSRGFKSSRCPGPWHPAINAVIGRAGYYIASRSGGVSSVMTLALNLKLFNDFGVLPACRPRHFAEFMPEVVNPGTNWGRFYAVPSISVIQRRQFERDNLREILHFIRNPDAPISFSGRCIAPLIRTLSCKTPERYYINVTESPGDRGGVIERDVLIHADKGRVRPDLPGSLIRRIRTILELQNCIVQAIAERDPRMLLQVMRQDPLGRHCSNPGALLDGLIRINRRWWNDEV